MRVKGTIGESERVESPPHPDPLRASFARLDPASGAREKQSDALSHNHPTRRNRQYSPAHAITIALMTMK
jgi:hypothetical protein